MAASRSAKQTSLRHSLAKSCQEGARLFPPAMRAIIIASTFTAPLSLGRKLLCVRRRTYLPEAVDT